MTLDIETYLNKDNFQIPYCICIYNGKICNSYYYQYFKSPEDILLKAIKSICIPEYNNYNVYAHNFSSFDGIFILKILNRLGNIEPVIKDGKIISVKLIYYNKAQRKYHSITFLDSILLLNASLRKLAKSFNTSTQKGNLDVTMIKENNYLHHKDEVIRYCADDCISLYQILVKFNNLFMERWIKLFHSFS
nr:hypothetical protein [Marasmius tenuissimus]UEX92819.1 hypothetical protein [Marasmius tenuissimus]UEX92900.1 hypothetical protein [Marasmius tenuissimus]